MAITAPAERAEDAKSFCKRRWDELFQRLTRNPKTELARQSLCEIWWDRIESGYTGPKRFYHNLDHVRDLLECADVEQDQIKDFEAMELAIFFHDLIYDPRAGGGTNEDLSGKEFMKFAYELSSYREIPSAYRIFDWIKHSATHNHDLVKDPQTDDGHFFFDFDLAVLAKDRVSYLSYAAKIRDEFSHMPNDVFLFGRRAFLEAHKEKRLFYKLVEYNAIAKENMEAEILHLEEKIQKYSIFRRGWARFKLWARKYVGDFPLEPSDVIFILMTLLAILLGIFNRDKLTRYLRLDKWRQRY